MKPIEATRRGVIAMGLSVGAAPLLPAAASEPAKLERASVPDFSACKDGIAIVITATSHHANIPVPVLLEQRRVRHVVIARQIGMYIAWMITDRGIIEIGRRFGNRDHTTVLQAVRTISKLAAADPAVNTAVEEISALCVEPMRGKGKKLTVMPISSSRLALGLNRLYDGVPWNV